MAIIKKYSPIENLSSFGTFIIDDNPNSDYFRITEFKDTFTGGKNGFLIEGSQYLKESTEIKIEILDVEGNTIYFEPGNGIPEYYEGISKLIAVYIYEDTPIGLGKITVLGELKQYVDNGVIRDVPNEWKGAYNVKWEKTFQINKNLANEDKVRFYRRPEVSIDEIVKPIFNSTPITVTQTGIVDGIPLIPSENSPLSNFSLPTSYRLKVKDETYWTGSVQGQTLSIPSLNYTTPIDDVVNKAEIIVGTPYTENGLVKSFTNESYSVNFTYLEGATTLATALTGSFAKINITDMKTFVGDAARIKVFRRSQSQLADYEFVQDIQLESTEILKDISTNTANEEYYGNFTEDTIDNYWDSSSIDLDVSLNQDYLYNSARLSSTNSEYFFTQNNISIQQGVEYNLSMNVRLGSNISTDNYLKVFLSGSFNGVGTTQTITTITSANSLLQKTNISENIIANQLTDTKLYFEVVGNDWYINNISLAAAQETSFSPDEITFIQQVPKTLPSETFDYRFEFYDINNNYIPVLVEETKTFDGGNLNLFQKSIELVPDQLYFAFDSASNPLPPTIINFDVNTTLVTGSVTFTSQSYDFFGNELSASEFAGGQYPGLLNDVTTDNPFLTVTNFTGSRNDLLVQYVKYVAEVEGVTDSVIITRVQDGAGGVNFEIRPYRGTVIKNKSDKDLEVQAIRIDGVNEVKLKSNLPQPGWSDAKLRVLSGSDDGTGTYILLSEASSSKFIRGLNAGTTGSKEINYNATFNRDAITNELVVFLMDGEDSGSILTSLILTDSLDGLGSGFVNFSAEQFSLKPRLDTTYTPTTASVTASFQDRFSPLAESFISGCLVVTPSASIDDIFNTHYYMFYETGTFDRRVSVTATDLLDNPVYSGYPGRSVDYYTALETKQLTLNFTYVEDITSASVSVDKTFYIVPEGKPGDDSILIDYDPRVLNLNADQRGRVYDYSPLDTTITVTQGRLPLTFSNSQKAGTFRSVGISSIGILTGSIVGIGEPSMSVVGYNSFTKLSGSIQYDLEIHPFFTASYYTQSVVQKITKGIDGAAALDLFINPLAVNFSGDESGTINDYAAGNTTLFVRQGEEYLSFSNTPGTPGTFTASLDLYGIAPPQISASAQYIPEIGNDTLHFLGYNGMPYTTASVDYNVTVYPFSLSNGVPSGSVTYKRTQIFSKAIAGKQARVVKLEASSTTVVYDGDDVVVSPEGSIILFANATGFSGSAYYQFFRDGFAYSLIDNAPEFEISSGDTVNSGETATWKVEARDGSPDAGVIATDEITIAGIKNGGDGFSIEITNPNASVSVEVDGTKDFSQTGTAIRAYKSNTELTHVSSYSSQTLDGNGNPIGTLGEFSSSLESFSPYITQPNIPTGNPASIAPITGWTDPQTYTTAELVYKIDIENGRAVFFKTQSLTAVFEGEVGPGIVFRGEWNNTTDYIFSLADGRRDSVIYDKLGEGLPQTYYIALQSNGPDTTPIEPEGDTDSALYWQELGQDDFFVAAKMAIFDESFVKNTINIGIPPPGNINANIAIVGGTDEPYISIGQTGTQGWAQPGVFLGLTNDGGPNGLSGTMGIMSLSGVPDGGGAYNSLEWDGEVLTIRGAVRQTAAGQIEGSNRGVWAVGVTYWPSDIVIYDGQSYVMISATSIVSTDNANVNTGYPDFATNSWEVAAAAGSSGTSGADAKSVRLSSDYQAFVVASDGSITPSTITLTSNRQNITDSTVFTSSPTVTLGGTGDTATLTSANFGANTSVTITATADGLSDEITIVKVEEGSNAITIVLSNESHTLQTSAAGTVTYTDSGTTISVYEGAELLDYVPSGTGNGEWDISVVSSNIIVGNTNPIQQSGTVGDRIAVVPDHGSMTANQASITYTISGKKLNGDVFSFTKIQSFSKSIAGNDGTSGSGGTSGTAGTSGADGAAGGGGAGVVYRGVYDAGNIYYQTAQRTDVVKGSDDSYYIVDNEADSGTTNWDNPVGGSDWTSFGAEFTSVATDILFAQDVYADRTVNIGSDGSNPVIALNADNANSNANPRIQIGQDIDAGEGFGDDGIYIGYNAGSPVLSFVTSSAGVQSYFIYESGSIRLSDVQLLGTGSIIEGSEILVGETSPGSGQYNFRVTTEGNLFAGSGSFRGTVTATDGAIGAWIVDSSAISSQNGQIELNATDEFIEIRNASLTPKVMLNTDTSLFDPGAAASVTFNSPAGGYYNANAAETFSAYGNSNDGFVLETQITTRSSTFTVGTTGVYSIVFDPSINNSYVEATGAGSTLNATTFIRIRQGSATGTIVTTIGQYDAEAYGFDSTGGPISVVGNTKLTLSDGTTILAKNITKEHKILAWDEVNGKYTEADISKIHSRSVNSTFRVTAGGKAVEVSDTHGFWLDGGKQIKVSDIVVGETKIYVKDGNDIKLSIVDSVEEIFGEEMVYTLTVPQYVNYVSNDIISHNAAGSSYPETERAYYPNTTKSKVVSLSSGVTYYLTFESSYAGYVQAGFSSDFTNLRGVQLSIDVESDTLVGQSTNAGTEINDSGFQVASGDDRVFRADTNTTAGNPWITQIGGARVDYFVPRYSIAPDASGYPKTYGQSNTSINYQDPAYPLTRAMCKVTISSSGPSVTASGPKINVASVTRISTGVYRVNLQSELSDWDGVAFASSHGRWQSSSPYYNNTTAGNDEYVNAVGIDTANADNPTLPSVTINFKDNDSNGDKDPHEFYFVMFG